MSKKRDEPVGYEMLAVVDVVCREFILSCDFLFKSSKKMFGAINLVAKIFN